MLDSSNFVRLFHRQSFVLYGNMHFHMYACDVSCTQDGEASNLGEVILQGISESIKWIKVKWDKGATYNYRIGGLRIVMICN